MSAPLWTLKGGPSDGEQVQAYGIEIHINVTLCKDGIFRHDTYRPVSYDKATNTGIAEYVKQT